MWALRRIFYFFLCLVDDITVATVGTLPHFPFQWRHLCEYGASAGWSCDRLQVAKAPSSPATDKQIRLMSPCWVLLGGVDSQWKGANKIYRFASFCHLLRTERSLRSLAVAPPPHVGHTVVGLTCGFLNQDLMQASQLLCVVSPEPQVFAVIMWYFSRSMQGSSLDPKQCIETKGNTSDGETTITVSFSWSCDVTLWSI